MFALNELPNLSDHEIMLIPRSRDEPDPDKGIVLRYGFAIHHIGDREDIGTIYLALDTSRRQYLRGHLSYGVSPAYAGHSYAMKACRLIRWIALAHGLQRLFVGCDHDNIPSRRTIEKLNAVPITVDDVPDAEILNALQRDKIDMYVWMIANPPESRDS